MPVNVDPLFTATPRTIQAKRFGTSWCHMLADTEAELDAMAVRLGLRLAWKQNGTPWRPFRTHFDLTPAKRAMAVRLGVVELTREELTARDLRLMREWREQQANGSDELEERRWQG